RRSGRSRPPSRHHHAAHTAPLRRRRRPNPHGLRASTPKTTDPLGPATALDAAPDSVPSRVPIDDTGHTSEYSAPPPLPCLLKPLAAGPRLKRLRSHPTSRPEPGVLVRALPQGG